MGVFQELWVVMCLPPTNSSVVHCSRNERTFSVSVHVLHSNITKNKWCHFTNLCVML